jgi:primosomal protein N' (replication factor Y)
MDRLAEIIISIHSDELDRPFTYRVPAGVTLQAGCRVIVPFASRRLEGYCVGVTADSAPGADYKYIQEVLDEEPVLTAELISLSEWGARRWLCRRVDFLQAMLPPGVRWNAEKRVKYVGAGQPDSEALAALKEKGTMPLDLWRRQFPDLSPQLLRRLESNGIIEVTSRERHGVGHRKVKLVVTVPGGDPAGVTGDKQQLTLKLLEENGAMTLAQLAGEGVGRSTVLSLERKGLLAIKEIVSRRRPDPAEEMPPEDVPLLTADQQEALRAISESSLRGQGTILLHGVTGSGKTEVYLRSIAGMLAEGRSSIVLVPEIALTPQMIERFTRRFGDEVAVLHSRLSAGERFDEWKRVSTGEARVVIGARSAVFAPVRNLGLLVLDEEHEYTYKQEESPRYHARDIALWRAGWHGAVTVLGSATPSLESFYLARHGDYTLCRLTGRAAGRPLPPVDVVDMRVELKSGNRSLFSRRLTGALGDVLAAGRQAILFLNRRAFATFVLCRSCGHVMRCPHCQVSLKYHSVGSALRCHYCDHNEQYPLVCPACAGRYIRHFGTGTQRVAAELQQMFPGARVERLDADAASQKGAHRRILTAFRRGETDILVGTQMVAKGLDFPNVTLVGVITADTSLNLPDFRAGERTFQLLTQVAGRAGRGEAGGRVVVQTYSPQHHAVTTAREHDYETFYGQEIQARAELGYPPFCRMVKILFAGPDEGKTAAAAEAFASIMAGTADLLGPSPCPIIRLRGNYRWQLAVRGSSLPELLAAVGGAVENYRRAVKIERVRMMVDVEPQNLL